MKWTALSAVTVGLLAKGPTSVAAVLAVSLVIVVIATYVFVARRDIAPRLRWGRLRIEFTRLPKDERD